MTTTISSNVEAPQIPQVQTHSKMSSYTLLYKSQVAIHQQKKVRAGDQGRNIRMKLKYGAMWKAASNHTSQALLAAFLIQLKPSCLTDGTTHSRKALYVNYPLRKCTINMPIGQANEGNSSHKVIPSSGSVKFKMQSNL